MALTKIPRGLLDTGIADSSDATAITIAANEDITLAGHLHMGSGKDITAPANLILDVVGDITLDADGGDVFIDDAGTRLLSISNAGSNNVQISTSISDGDLLFKGNDGGSIITALTLDMSDAGAAIFNSGHAVVSGATYATFRLEENDATDVNTSMFNSAGDFVITTSNDARSSTTDRLRLDHATGDIGFYKANGSAQALFWDASAESLGIGTTSPDLTLHVDGANGLPAASGTTPNGMLMLRDKTGGATHGLYMGVSNASPWGSWLQAADAGNLATEYPLFLNPNGGNVGIGTTSTSEVLNLYAPNNTSGGIEIAGNANTLGSTSMFVGQGSSGIGYLWQRANEYLMIATNNTERMRVDASGYVQFGASVTTHVGTSQVFINRGVNASAVTSGTTQTGAALRLRGGDNAILDMGMNSVNTWIQATDRANLANLYHIALNPNGGAVSVGNYSTSDRFEVYKNTNGNFATYIAQDNPGGYGMGVRGDGGSMIYFYIGGTYQGHIYSSGGSTTYGTGSDYRLKDNVVEMKGAINDLKKLRPVTFNFKESPDVPQQGFIAHEAQEVVPHAVAGEKDAKIDEEHQIGYQSMEYGKVTPLLTSALQEAIAKIEILEAKVAALESK